jgi:RNA polymerase sigma-70 factor (ECF subfamily)
MSESTAVADRNATRESGELGIQLEEYRTELTAYCYRMLGAAFEAEDAVQETLVRAWLSFDRFEGRSALRSWLYRIATNVCLDMLNGSQRRARPMDLGSPQAADTQIGEARSEATWIQPVPDASVLSPDGDPADIAVARESIRLAFVAALQHLPPKQRAVLILKEVLRWRADEIADLLDTTVASVNSALQRARATLASEKANEGETVQPLDEDQRILLARYVQAFERYDLDSLTSLLHEDATLSMPPYELWLEGPVEIRRWLVGHGIGCRGSRLVATVANGSPAFGQYRPAIGGGYEPWALQVIEISAGRITGINSFLDTASLFPLFGLPSRLGPSAERDHVAQPHEGEEIPQLVASVTQPQLASEPTGGEL